MNLGPGTLIDGKLRLEQKLGDGGMGSVWLAEHLKVERKVALKLLSPRLVPDGAARESFLREARAIARLRSGHVPQILDFGTIDDGTPFIAMERLQGEDLHDRLSRGGALEPSAVVTLVSHVAAALGEAHSLGIVHCDVKPENIFLVPDDDGGFVAKLIDFGLATWMGADDGSGGLAGTPSYMSPERLLGTAATDARSDLWALAVVAYEALTGRLPFRGDTFADAAAAITTAVFPPPSRFSRVPPTVDAWFAQALARDPQSRFQSARQLSRALRLAGEVTEAPFLLQRKARAILER